MRKSFVLFINLIFLASFNCRNYFPSDIFDITDYGAEGDGEKLNTTAIQRAIDAANRVGGGRVVVPPGVYIAGTLFLRSNIVFEVQAGAIILGSPDIAHYKEMTWGHNKDRQPYHLIVAKNVQNVTIAGGGTIDGNGPAFWQDYNPADNPQWIQAKETKVSPMMEIQSCRDVIIKEVLLKTGGGWTLHLYDSDRIQVRGVRIIDNQFSPNDNGIVITGCFDVTVSDCFIRTCDDAICLKTTGDSRECRRVAVTNCTIECSCAALKIGNESFRDIGQVTISNCVVYNSSRAFAIYAESAGTIEDVTVCNIICDTRAPLIYNRPIHISLFRRINKDGTLYSSGIYSSDKIFDDEGREPHIRNVLISNFVAQTEGRVLVTAERGRMIENLTLRDIQLTYPMIEDPVPNIERTKSRQFSPMNPDAKKARAAIVAENVRNLFVDGLNINWPETGTVPEEWRHPKRIANGTFDAFYLDYTKARQTEFSAVWGRNLQGGYIFAPLARSSDRSMDTFDLPGCDIKVVRAK